MSVNLHIRASSIPRTSAAVRMPQWLWVTAGYLVLCVILFWPALITGSVPLPLGNSAIQGDPVWAGQGEVAAGSVNLLQGDVSGFYYPYLVYSVERLRAGDFPLWNPGIFGGMPYFAANQAALLYPVNLLTFWFGPQQYWVAAAIVRLLLAGWGMFLLARRFGASSVAAFAAGTVFMLADFNMVWLHFAIHNVAALLPLALWLIHRMLQASRPVRSLASSDMPVLALVIAAQMFGGHPEMSLFFLVMCAVFALAFVPKSATTGMGRKAQVRSAAGALARVGAGITLGLLLSAVQWVPTLALLHSSYTYAERSFAATHSSGEQFAPLGAIRQADWANLRSWLLLVQPQLWGSPRGNAIANWGPAGTNYNEMTPFVGLAALALAILGAWRGANRSAARFFGALVGASLLLLYPLPGLGQLGYLPLLDVAHGFRFGLSVALGAALLVALGIDQLAQPVASGRVASHWRRSRRRQAEAWSAVALVPCRQAGSRSSLALLGLISATLALLSLGATLLVVSPVGVALLGIANTSTTQAQIAQVFCPANWRLLLPAAAAVALTALAWWSRRSSLSRAVPAAMAALLVAAELLAYGAGYNGLTPMRDVYPHTAATRMLARENDAGRVLPLDNALWANTGMTQGIEVTSGMDDLLEAEQKRFLQRGLSGIGTTASAHVLLDWGRRLADVASARYIIARQPVVAQETRAELPLVLHDGALRVYANQSALPRAYAAFQTVPGERRNAENLVFSSN
ncbi:MAG TPA: hypothetical protein VFT99_23455, partial [Roseiflexaceae bacterium]|nr:hypothetical protein [Roseiflexaceae bacterium]